MHILEYFIWANPDKSISGLHIYCDEEKKKEISEFFQKTFQEELEKAQREFEESYGDEEDWDDDDDDDDDEREWPSVLIREEDYGLLCFFDIDSFVVSCCYGEICDMCDEVLENTLMEIDKKYPGLSYEGYVAYYFTDRRGGDVYQYSVKSKDITEEKKAFDFVATGLYFSVMHLEDEMEGLEESDFEEALALIISHSWWLSEEALQECLDKILEIADAENEEFRENLEKTIEKLKAERK